MANQRELVERLFEAALGLTPGDRTAFLDSECNGNPELRREVETLLTADVELGSFPEHSALQGLTADSVSPPTTVIGPYHLRELIGEGGMGEVWLAEQTQPVRRRVAIKLIKAGMDTREVVARFESERQALALMDHPAIAKVFEAGSTPDGRPYFVMEYVAGVPITTFCDWHKLTIRQRMELFVLVCEGVQHAHQNAIIHRDLKPSNILVAVVDGKPMPCIIDFGVAIATSQKLTAGTIYTRMLIGTLGYMSPEQADPIGEDIDTRTDVYSLGAVLYELLTGALPVYLENLAYDEVLRRLHDQDVPRPSTKITTLGEDSAIAARNRGSDPPTLVRQLRGDPDVIALKALERDRARRYASASELVTDIGRYLRNEPVTAHPPDIAYRTRKYLRRHRLGLAVASSAVMGIALAITWWRMSPGIPVVESVSQLTDDGQPKSWLVSNGSHIYFTEGEAGNRRIAQVSVTGGQVTQVETGFANPIVEQVARDGSGLLVRVPSNNIEFSDGPLWWIPLPAGEPRRLGSFTAEDADMLPDGRIVFVKFTPGTDPKNPDDRTQWFIADKDGSNPHELVSLPGLPDGFLAEPGGRRVFGGQLVNGDRRLLEIGTDGRGFREIRKTSDNECCFTWTPDEKYLVYQSGNVRHSDIWLLPMRTAHFRHNPIRLTNGAIPYSHPSPDGKQIFVLGTKQRGELVRYDIQSHEFRPFLSGISAINPTFSRDGKWVAYLSYPDHALWRSRSDGAERKQLTFPPTPVFCPSISPDGTKVAFGSGAYELFVISMEGGQQQKIDERAFCADWSPDGNYLYHQTALTGAGGVIVDVRTGSKSLVPSSEQMFGFWLNQDTLMAQNYAAFNKFQTFNLRTQKWTDFAPGISGDYVVLRGHSPDGRYLYYTTGGADPKVLRLRIADHHLETITSLNDLHRAVNHEDNWLNVAPDGSPIITSDTGYQEIYALNIRWP